MGLLGSLISSAGRISKIAKPATASIGAAASAARSVGLKVPGLNKASGVGGAVTRSLGSLSAGKPSGVSGAATVVARVAKGVDSVSKITSKISAGGNSVSDAVRTIPTKSNPLGSTVNGVKSPSLKPQLGQHSNTVTVR